MGHKKNRDGLAEVENSENYIIGWGGGEGVSSVCPSIWCGERETVSLFKEDFCFGHQSSPFSSWRCDLLYLEATADSTVHCPFRCTVKGKKKIGRESR